MARSYHRHIAIDPELLRALERSVVDDPGNRALRLHLVDLLLEDGQHAAALGHCEALLRADADDAEARDRQQAARAALGLPVDHDVAVAEGEGGDPITPSVSDLAEIVRPEVTLDDVAGMADVKQQLRLSFLEPLRNRAIREAFGHTLRSGLLLWGPPGCGKTYIAKALAGELGLYFVHVGIADVLDMWIGSSERNMHAVFEEARTMSPAVLFFDELDALGHKRAHLRTTGTRNVVNQLLVELDGVNAGNEGVLVLAATNQPWDVDSALLRPGRFDRQILVLPPDEPAREAILVHHLARTPTRAIDPKAIARDTDGFSGADLAGLCARATEFAMHESAEAGEVRPIGPDHLRRALAGSSPSTDSWFRLADNYIQFADDSDRYENLARYIASRNRRRR